jgi:hypothetical protein
VIWQNHLLLNLRKSFRKRQDGISLEAACEKLGI